MGLSSRFTCGTADTILIVSHPRLLRQEHGLILFAELEKRRERTKPISTGNNAEIILNIYSLIGPDIE